MTARILKFPMERVRKAPRQEWKLDPGSGWFDWPSVPASPNYTMSASYFDRFIADFVQPQQRNNGMDGGFDPPKGAA